MTKQKVIFLSSVSYFKGGAERSLFDLLSNPNIEPVLLSPAEGEIVDKAAELNIPTHILPFGTVASIRRPFSFVEGLGAFRSLFKAALQLKKITKEEGACIVHSNGLKAHAINCTAQWLRGGKAFLHIRDIAYTKSEILVWKILRLLCTRMIIVSRACWPEEKLPSKVHVIHNGIDADHIGCEVDKTLILPLTVGFIGRIHPAKGLHLLIDWVAQSRQAGHDLKLDVRGAYSEDSPDYEAEINDKIEKLQIQSSVQFTGFVDNAEDVYKGIDITVVPSHIPDPLPRSVMESMARGLPVLAYPAGGVPDMIEDGVSGFLVHDYQSFERAINVILSDPERCQQMKVAARQKIKNKFSKMALFDGLNELYSGK